MRSQIHDLMRSPRLTDVFVGGGTGAIFRTFFEKRILSEFARTTIFAEAEDAFRTQKDGAQPTGLWQGEFWGKQVLSAAEVYKYTGDETLKSFLHGAARRLLSLAREDGYLNTYADSLNVFPADPAVTQNNWNWNVWCRKYTLWGLLAVYEITEDDAILEGARRLARQMIGEFRENGVELRRTGMFCGLPSGSILKPLLLLYRHTGDETVLDYCVRDIADNWERADNACPNLITNALSGKRISAWYPQPQFWAKAYEMMSCFEGLTELYRVTGTARYLRAAENFYEILVRHEQNPLFSVAYNDMFADAAHEITAVSEPCDPIHFMRLCYELYCLTGEKKYMDSFELAYYNAFLAGVFRDGEWCSRGVRGAGRHMWTRPQAKMQHHHCCVDNTARGLLRYADAAVMAADGTAAVNLFEECEAVLHFDDGDCLVHIAGGYFAGQPVTVTAEFSGTPKDLMIRIPAWCDSPVITADGTWEMDGGYAVIPPKGSRCTVTVDFGMKPVLHTFADPIPEDPSGRAWHLERWTSHYAKGDADEDVFRSATRHTMSFGPLLLAKSKRLGCTEEDIFARYIDGGYACRLTPVETDSVRAAFRAEFTKGDECAEMTVCDFASAANEILDDKRYFSIYF